MRISVIQRTLIVLSAVYNVTFAIIPVIPSRPPSFRTISSDHVKYGRSPQLPVLFMTSMVGAFSAVPFPDWILDFHAFHTFLPQLTAASTLMSFYEEVAAIASTTTSPITDRLFFRTSGITLEIRSALGAVPWAEVIRLANWMRDNTNRGFTGTYQVNFVHRPTGKLLTMSLWIGILRWG